jgi:hypothetical protein
MQSFAAIIRTTGDRPRQLLQALQSVSLQQIPCMSVVVVHGDDGALASVNRAVEGNGNAQRVTVLHADDTRRKRGYPVNVGIDYCIARQPEIKFVFLLDDDDIVYPYFTSMLARTFPVCEADIVYAASNRKEPGDPPSRGTRALPIGFLFKQNFIPSNSYAVRLESLRKSGLRMDETLEYLEDWHFLLRMVESGFRFQALPMELSEFRIATARECERNSLPEWRESADRIRQYIHAGSFPLPGAELARLDLPLPPRDASDNYSLQLRVQELEHSLCWRWTAPVRQIAGLFRLRAGWPKSGA